MKRYWIEHGYMREATEEDNHVVCMGVSRLVVLAAEVEQLQQDAVKMALNVLEAHRGRLRAEGYEEEDVLLPLNFGPLEQLAQQVVEKYGTP